MIHASNALITHTHTRTDKHQKPYPCTETGCPKRYTDPSSLRKHQRSHKRINIGNTHNNGDLNHNFVSTTTTSNTNPGDRSSGYLDGGQYTGAQATANMHQMGLDAPGPPMEGSQPMSSASMMRTAHSHQPSDAPSCPADYDPNSLLQAAPPGPSVHAWDDRLTRSWAGCHSSAQTPSCSAAQHDARPSERDRQHQPENQFQQPRPNGALFPAPWHHTPCAPDAQQQRHQQHQATAGYSAFAAQQGPGTNDNFEQPSMQNLQSQNHHQRQAALRPAVARHRQHEQLMRSLPPNPQLLAHSTSTTSSNLNSSGFNPMS